MGLKLTQKMTGLCACTTVIMSSSAIVMGASGAMSVFVLYKLMKTYRRYDKQPKTNSKEALQIIRSTTTDTIIHGIEYLGSGACNDAYTINISSASLSIEKQVHIFRFPRHKRATKELKREMSILSQLNENMSSINSKIIIPNYNKSLSTDKYGVYPMIKGTILASLSQTQQIQIINDNSDEIAKFLAYYHSFDLSLKDKQELTTWEPLIVWEYIINKIKELPQKPFYHELFVDKTCRDFIENNIISKLENKILPLFKSLIENGKREMFDIGLIHLDLKMKHFILCENEQIGIIDWGDLSFADLAGEFQRWWVMDKEMCHNIVRKYDEYRKKKLGKFFYARLDLYGFCYCLRQVFGRYQNGRVSYKYVLQRLIDVEIGCWDDIVQNVINSATER